jgi:hypothetical protein
MDLQYLITAIVLALAIAYAGYLIFKALANKDAQCAGCALKDHCEKNKRIKRQNCKK